MDVPHQLFTAIVAGGKEELQRMIEEQRQEDLYLDFKQAQSPMTTDDKRSLATALSGFANSDGGVIVWGVKAAKGPDDLDCARSLEPIPNLRLFMTNLKDHTVQSVTPAVPGVEHAVIEDSALPGAGYAVTLVPRSDGLPHMAVAKEQWRFYYRAGDSFLAMPHFMLADRFGRRPQPKLDLVWRLETPTFHSEMTAIVISVHNKGLGLALYPAVHLEERRSDDQIFEPIDQAFAKVHILDGSYNGYGWPERIIAYTPIGGHRWRAFAGGANDVIHSGVTQDIAAIRWNVPRQSKVEPRDIVFQYALFGDGFAPIEGTMTIPGQDIVDYAQRSWNP